MQEDDRSHPTIAAKAGAKVARASVVIFIGQASSTVILSVASMIIARLLGPADYGSYSIALSVAYLMLLFTDFGVNSALVRFAARFRSEERNELIQDLIETGIGFEFVTGLLMFLVSLFLADILANSVVNRPSIVYLIQIASPAILGSALLTTSSSIFVGLDEAKKAALLSALSAMVKLIMAPTLIILGLGVAGATVGHVLHLLIAGIIGAFAALKTARLPKHRSGTGSSFSARANLGPMVRYGMPLYASSLMGGFLSQFRTIVLPWFTSNTEIGNYSVALVCSSAVVLLTTPIATALFPGFSELGSKNATSDLRQFFLHSLRYTLFLVTPASVFMAITSGDIVAVFYGSKYVQAQLYLRIYSATFLSAPFSLVLGSFYRGIGRTDIPLKATLIDLSTTLPLLVALASVHGVIGAICATIVSGILPIIYVARIAHREYGLEFDSRRVVKILLASVISGAPSLAATLLPYPHIVNLVLAGTVFGATYLTVAPILGAIGYEDLVNLRLILKDTGLIFKLSSVALCYMERILSVVLARRIDY